MFSMRFKAFYFLAIALFCMLPALEINLINKAWQMFILRVFASGFVTFCIYCINFKLIELRKSNESLSKLNKKILKEYNDVNTAFRKLSDTYIRHWFRCMSAGIEMQLAQINEQLCQEHRITAHTLKTTAEGKIECKIGNDQTMIEVDKFEEITDGMELAKAIHHTVEKFIRSQHKDHSS